ncbi:MAG: hypothetical protein GY774_40135 [Planctomycetes bacterium]|nr:hypothetical protein [Planctomycetota bacterium]
MVGGQDDTANTQSLGTKMMKSFRFIARIALEIQQLQDIFDGVLLADPATRPRGTVKDQILLLRLRNKASEATKI